jgi:alpha-mannosidase
LENGRDLGVISVPSMGYAIQTPTTPAETVSVSKTKSGFCLENQHLKAEFNEQAGLTSLIHKAARRESIEPGAAGNTFVLYEDIPNNWDAWDVDAFHLEKKLLCGGAISAKILESGPLRASIAFDFAISSKSVMRQVISLDALAAQLEFSCDVDWHERQKFLKVEFPLNVRAQFATYEIQFGYVQRPTNFNTSFDMARFEVSAHKWADLSEPGFGVALLNDCKYGYAAHSNVLRLSLLRAPTSPDPQADQGRHHFRFAVLPHTDSPQFAGITEAAYRFNVPLLMGRVSGQDIQKTFFALDNSALIIDTIKKAEDSNALILRLYESQGTRSTARLTGSLPVRSAMLVNLLEDEIAQLDWQDGVNLEFKPFEIISVRLEMV